MTSEKRSRKHLMPAVNRQPGDRGGDSRSMSFFTCVHNDFVGNNLCEKDSLKSSCVLSRGAASTVAEPWTGSHMPWRACYAMPCHPMPCHTIPCHAVPWRVMEQPRQESPKERGARNQQKTRQGSERQGRRRQQF